MQAMVNSVPRLVRYATPLSHSFLATGAGITTYPAIAAAIVTLLDMRSPFTVTRPIISVVINSFNSHSVRPHTHVCQKVFKLVPSLTYANATASIRGGAAIPASVTSHHFLPTAICWRRSVFAVVPVFTHTSLPKKYAALCSSFHPRAARFSLSLSVRLHTFINLSGFGFQFLTTVLNARDNVIEQFQGREGSVGDASHGGHGSLTD